MIISPSNNNFEENNFVDLLEILELMLEISSLVLPLNSLRSSDMAAKVPPEIKSRALVIEKWAALKFQDVRDILACLRS